MKLTSILLLIAVLHVSARSVSQTVTFVGREASLKKVFDAVKKQTGYLVFYNKDLLETAKPVTVSAQHMPLTAFLETALKDQMMDYLIENRTIFIRKKAAHGLSVNADGRSREAPLPPVTGVVYGPDGQPLAGVNIVLKGAGTGVVSDGDGRFSINVPANAILVFSYTGFETVEIRVNEGASLQVELRQSEGKIDSVVVVGYGTQKKINLTGAVDVIAGAALQNRSAPTLSLLMQGLSPNLNIEMSNRGGEPGASSSWNIRGFGSISGNASPLILIDGVESAVDDLDPESVQSVSVLKDASASAIYGSRAPFGVVLITTKAGTRSKGVKISYNPNFSWASPLRLPEFRDAYTWATVFNQAQANEGLAPVYPDEQVERIKGYMAGTYKDEYDINNPPGIIWNGRWQGNANYNWPRLFFKRNSLSVKHNINLEGGDEKTQYFISGGYYDQGGLYNWGNDSYKRYNLMANLSSRVNNWLRFNFGTRFAQTITDYPLGIVGTPRSYNFQAIFNFAPMTPWHNADGSVANPIVRSFQASGRDQTTTNDLWLKLGTEIEPVKGWKTNLAYNYNIGAASNFQNPHPVPVQIPNGATGNIGTSSAGAVENEAGNNYFIFNAVTTYEKNIGDHFLKLMGGFEEELNNYRSLYGSRMGLITQEIPAISAATGASTLHDTRGHWSTEAFFGRLNYSFNDKYLLEFSGRYNGSSRFAKDSRWGFFPSASAGYNISKENFWSPLSDYVGDLKIRGSYGSLGNQNVNNYLYVSTIPVGSNFPYVIGNERPIYANPPEILSSSLTWETVTTLDFGIDASFLRERLMLTFDWYNRKTTNMFGPAQDLPAVLGASTPSENNAELSTKGFELSLDWKDKITSDLHYNIRVTLSDNRSTILKYKNDNKIIDDWYDGKQYGEIWGFETDGLIQKAGEPMPDQSKYYSVWGPGDIKYKDLNGDGILNDGNRMLSDHGDLRIIGNISPRYAFGFSAGLSWKSLSFSMFWQGILKRDYLPDSYASVFWGVATGGSPGSESSINKGSPSLDYWRPADETNFLGPNTDAYFPKPYFDYDQFMKNHQDQSRYVLNAGYARLKNIMLNYTIPVRWSKKVFMKTARIYVSGENLITITQLPEVLDPETVYASDRRLGGRESTSFVYPVSKRYSCGLNISF
ncbi:MAG: TonB-dependent receptor [Chitinophagaceae bacterium]|nr:TonB-dependent receptor [Chitinophagaceae bacterium]